MSHVQGDTPSIVKTCFTVFSIGIRKLSTALKDKSWLKAKKESFFHPALRDQEKALS